MKRRRLIEGLAAIGTVGLAGCAGLPGFADDFDVGMSPNAYHPTSIEVSVGDTVVWYNDGSRGHTVTAYEDAIPEGGAYFASGGFSTEAEAREEWQVREGGNIVTGEYFRHTFEVAGHFPYFCVPHEGGGMIADVWVTE